MSHHQKKLFVLPWFSSLFRFFKKRNGEFFQELETSFNDPYLCGMVDHFGLLHDWIFKPYFEKVRISPEEIALLKKLSLDGTLVYVMKNRGQLEYSFFNHLFLKEGIPLARFANGCRTLYWRPLKDIVKGMLARFNHYFEKGKLRDPIRSGFLEKKLIDGESALLNLKVSREFIFGASEDPLVFIPPLIRAAGQSSKPIYLITQQFLYDRHPEKARKSWIDFLFGEKSNPGLFRKLILFVISYRRKATVKFGEPLDLKKFIQDNPASSPMEQASDLKDILLSRLMIERKSITGPILKNREWFLEKILEDTRFKEQLELIRKESNKPLEELHKNVSSYFHEIAARINYSYIDFYNSFIHWLTNNIYDGLDIDTEGLAKIKAIAGKYPVVLVPSHKSHLDYLLLSYIFYNYDLTLPHVCAGINLKFWPAGPLIRRGGGFFIRRSLGGNKLYKLVLEYYLKTLVREGYSIEFFIEGTRSRTGKLLKPKMGILSMLVQAYLEQAAPDIYFVPLSINYERIMEAKSYAQEIHGGEKEKENVKGIIQAGNKIRNKYGRVSIQFAPPLSIKEFLNEKNLSQATAISKTNEECRLAIQEFAYRITYNINKVSLVTSTSLVAIACLTYPKKGIPEKEILKRAHILKTYLDYKGVNFSAVIRQNEQWAYREALQKLSQDRTLETHRDFHEKFYTIGEALRSSLDYHKNNSIHFFISLVCFSKICSMALREASRDRSSSSLVILSLAEIEKKYETLKTLLRHDFTFSERATLREHLLKVIAFYAQEKFLTYHEAQEEVHLNRLQSHPGFYLFNSLLDNFFESYWLALLYIKYVSFEKMEKKRLITFILEKGKTLHMKGELRYPEALSRFNLENALLVFEDVGLIQSEEKGLLTRKLDNNSMKKWEEILESLSFLF